MLHNSFIKYCIVALIAMTAFGSLAKKKENVEVPAPYAWTMSNPLANPAKWDPIIADL